MGKEDAAGVMLSRCDGPHWVKAARGWRSPWQLEDLPVDISGDGAGLVVSSMPAWRGAGPVGSQSLRDAWPQDSGTMQPRWGEESPGSLTAMRLWTSTELPAVSPGGCQDSARQDQESSRGMQAGEGYGR